MSNVSRRDFLKVAGAGSAALVGIGGAGVGKMIRGRAQPTNANAFAFRATTGLPQHPFPSYASLVLKGNVDATAAAGAIQRSVVAGPPEAMSDMVLPGTTRLFHITGVRRSGNALLVDAAIEDPNTLGPGESPSITVAIDRAAGLVRAPFIDRELKLQLTG